MEEKSPKKEWSQRTVLLSVLALCVLLFFIVQCVRYAGQTRELTAENERLSAALADREQTIDDNTDKLEKLQKQLATAASMEESETKTGFDKKSGIYLIDDYRQLWTLRQMIAEGAEIEPGISAASASYRLRNDIDFLSRYDPVPVFYLGTEETPFRGSFDGDGHCIWGYFPLMGNESCPEAMFYKDATAQIENLHISNQAANLGAGAYQGLSSELTAPWEIKELERHLPDFPGCSIKVEISDWDLEVQQTAEGLRQHWEKLLSQEEARDCYVSMTFYPQGEESVATTEPAALAHDEHIHEEYLQKLRTAFLTLGGAEYSDLIEETLANEDGYLWFLRLERIEGLLCCTFEIGIPDSVPNSNSSYHYYLIAEGEWEGKEVTKQCLSIPYTFGEESSIGVGSSFEIENVDLDFDGKADLLIHEGYSGGSGGFWSNYRAIVWKEDSGQFIDFPSFPEQVSSLELDRQRIVSHGRSGYDNESVGVYEVVNGEYVCTKELVCQSNGDGTVIELSYYEMGELVKTHMLSNWNEKETLYPDLDYWFKG